MEINAKIVDVRRVDSDFLILRALYEDRKGIVITEDLIIQIKDKGINTEKIKEGREIKIFEEEGRIHIIL